ncbi:alpha/beta hydrolase [Bacillus sp. FJAT-42376]|uniref:alpha/beta hydrolase n=1 Tax=Bacillus sp. FJAT-42376 TaxID=2014076 RepID=UPI000F4DEAC3|nr:alpha/beta hydrolase [Bacillus sp. FJAT-42376]AZB44055.1 alpha/beta hydrolase [Bacillus sp. FJAT-42376]
MWKWEAERPKGVIVMVHGAAEHHRRYKWLIEMWRCAGYHVIMGDLPGQGTSTRRRGHIQSFSEYITELNRWLTEADKYDLPLFLLGHSMGGLIAIRALQEKEHNLAGVILSSPCLGLIHKPNAALDAVSRGLNIVTPALLLKSNLSIEMATRNKSVIEIDENDSLYVTKVSIRWYRELIHAVHQANDKQHTFPDVPLLVMQGGDDKIVDKTAVKSWFNRLDSSEKSYKEWKGFYHEIFNEPERDQVFKMALAFAEYHLPDLPAENWSEST